MLVFTLFGQNDHNQRYFNVRKKIKINHNTAVQLIHKTIIIFIIVVICRLIGRKHKISDTSFSIRANKTVSET